MKKYFFLCGLFGIVTVLYGVPLSFSEEGLEQEVRPVWREAVDIKGNIVAIDISLVGEDLLEAKVTGFMEQERPRLKNILLVGPGVGRLSPTTRKTILAGLEEDEPYPTRRSGLLVLNQGSKRTAKGTLTRERCQFTLPLEKMREKIIKKGKKAHYEFWVFLESSNRGGDFLRFKFDLDPLPELILAETEPST